MGVLNYDIMELIGRELQIVRETEKNKANYGKVMEAINSIRPFVEINRVKHEYWYRNEDSMRTEPLNPNDDDWFIRNLWDCSACECWWHCDGDSDEEDYEPSPEPEDWLKACPFKYQYGGCGDYYSVLSDY